MEMKMIGKAMIVAAGMLISMPVMAEEWEITVSDDSVVAAITGNITYGERQRFIFNKGNCKVVEHIFSTYTEKAANFKDLTGAVLAVEFNGSIIGAKLIAANKAMAGHLLMFSFGSYDKDVLLKIFSEDDKISMTFIDGNGHTASELFDMPKNEWDISEIAGAFEDAYKACSSL
jgi:hypothetical protein